MSMAAAAERILAELPDEAHRQEVRLLLAARAAQAVVVNNRARWMADPVAWARERVHTEPWSKQQEILGSVRDNRRTLVASCNSAGKSKTAALAVAWWLDVHPPGTAFVVSTAPTFSQVRAILWREIRALHRDGDLGGRVNNTEWINADGDLIGYGRKPADTDAVAFLGIHALNVLVVLDEACGVPRTLWDATESIATNDNARVLAIGNPDDPGSEFARSSVSPLWNFIQISAFDTPNLTGEPVSERLANLLVSRQWVEDRAVAWGTDSPMYVSRVLGQFPIDVETRAVPFAHAIACVNVEPPFETKAELLAMTPVVLGLDIGEGTDETVLQERRGNVAYRQWSRLTHEPEQVANLAVMAIIETGARILNYDAGGPGWSIGALIRARLDLLNIKGVVLNPIQFGGASAEPLKYKNKRAEMVWGIGRLYSQDHIWYLGAMVDEEGEPAFADAIAELTDQHWFYGVGDRIVIESKEDIRKRTGRSPDHSDALMLSFARGVAEPTVVTVPTGTLPTGAKAMTRPNGRGNQLPVRSSMRSR